MILFPFSNKWHTGSNVRYTWKQERDFTCQKWKIIQERKRKWGRLKTKNLILNTKIVNVEVERNVALEKSGELPMKLKLSHASAEVE
jgi:hypothetical protein